MSDDPRRLAVVLAVGVAETAFLAARRGQHTQFVIGIGAMAGPGRPRAQLLDVVPGRTRSAVERWFSACDPALAGRDRDGVSRPVPRLRDRPVDEPARRAAGAGRLPRRQACADRA